MKITGDINNIDECVARVDGTIPRADLGRVIPLTQGVREADYKPLLSRGTPFLLSLEGNCPADCPHNAGAFDELTVMYRLCNKQEVAAEYLVRQMELPRITKID